MNYQRLQQPALLTPFCQDSDATAAIFPSLINTPNKFINKKSNQPGDSGHSTAEKRNTPPEVIDAPLIFVFSVLN